MVSDCWTPGRTTYLSQGSWIASWLEVFNWVGVVELPVLEMLTTSALSVQSQTEWPLYEVYIRCAQSQTELLTTVAVPLVVYTCIQYGKHFQNGWTRTKDCTGMEAKPRHPPVKHTMQTTGGSDRLFERP